MEQGTEEWLEMRKKKVGASDTPVILGISPWKSVLTLWKEKMNLVTKLQKTYAMQRGILLEEPARQKFIEKTGIKVTPKIKVHPKHNWMMASLDGMSDDGKTIVEIKCAGRKDHSLAEEGIIPEHYVPQIQHQMEVCGVDKAFYFSFNGEEGIILEMDRDERYIRKILKCGSYFMTCMSDFVMPSEEIIDKIMEREAAYV
jgi:putative phage-type endonuclease